MRNSSTAAILACLMLTTSSLALYSSTSKVVKLTAANFKQKVLDSKELWFVEFYAPWCGHCKNLAPQFEKVARGLEGIINVGAVDMTTDQAAGASYGIQGYPTLKFFGNNKNKPADYNGGRDAASMINFAIERAKTIANARAFYNGSNGSNKGGQQKQQQQQKKKASGGSGGAGVEVLTTADFKDKVYNSKDVWMVEFYAPWCGHCKALQPEWEAAARDTSQVRWGKVDCTVEQSVCGDFGVQGYPTIKYFEPMARNHHDAKDYNGARSSSALGSHAAEVFNKASPPKEFKRLTSQQDYDEYCGEARGICVIYLLEHKLDVGDEGREKQLSLVKAASETFKGRPVNFLWSQGGDQFEIEDRLGVAGGYPKVLAISHGKGKYLSMIHAFTSENIQKWINTALAGRLGFYDLPKNLPKFKKIASY